MQDRSSLGYLLKFMFVFVTFMTILFTFMYFMPGSKSVTTTVMGETTHQSYTAEEFRELLSTKIILFSLWSVEVVITGFLILLKVTGLEIPENLGVEEKMNKVLHKFSGKDEE